MPFTAVADYPTLLTQPTPRDMGVLLHGDDPTGLKLSVQIARKVEGASVWDGYGNAPGWDEAIWDDPSVIVWTDVSERVRALDWNRGRTDPQTQPEAGTATLVLDNLDGALSPWLTEGDWVEPIDEATTASVMRPGVLVRFGVTDSAEVWTPWFAGALEAADDGSERNVDAFVTLTAVDLLGVLATYGHALYDTATPDGRTGAGMAAGVLADISWPYGQTVAAEATLFETATLIAPDPAQNRLEALRLIAASCDGYLLASVSDLLLLSEDGFAVYDVTLTNDPADAGDIPIESATPYANDDRLLNVVTGQSALPTSHPQKATDTRSIYRHGVKASGLGWPRADLLNEHDGDVRTTVRNVVARQADDYRGFSEAKLNADMAPALLYPVMAALAAAGLEEQRQLPIRWVHPSGTTYEATVRLAGLHATLIPVTGDDAEARPLFTMSLNFTTVPGA